MFEPGRSQQMPRTPSVRQALNRLSALFFCLMTAVFFVAAGPTRADFADGMEAFDGGDLNAAIAAWRQAAAMGDLDAAVALADLHYQGIGLPRDASAAAALYRKAAQAGHKIARLNLGELYDLGDGVARNPAVQLFARSLVNANQVGRAGPLRLFRRKYQPNLFMQLDKTATDSTSLTDLPKAGAQLARDRRHPPAAARRSCPGGFRLALESQFARRRTRQEESRPGSETR